jgi:hypothetical protein
VVVGVSQICWLSVYPARLLISSITPCRRTHQCPCPPNFTVYEEPSADVYERCP